MHEYVSMPTSRSVSRKMQDANDVISSPGRLGYVVYHAVEGVVAFFSRYQVGIL
jgi:hypothetical protein